MRFTLEQRIWRNPDGHRRAWETRTCAIARQDRLVLAVALAQDLPSAPMSVLDDHWPPREVFEVEWTSDGKKDKAPRLFTVELLYDPNREYFERYSVLAHEELANGERASLNDRYGSLERQHQYAVQAIAAALNITWYVYGDNQTV